MILMSEQELYRVQVLGQVLHGTLRPCSQKMSNRRLVKGVFECLQPLTRTIFCTCGTRRMLRITCARCLRLST